MTSLGRARELGAFLSGAALFAALDEMTRLRLAEQLEPVHVAAGDAVSACKETSRDITDIADGTAISYDQQGSGPPLIVVDGAMSTRASARPGCARCSRRG
ncbi:MAG: hypothetical protein ACLQFR_19100 [Streptosporangiaceae bacterium]